MSSTLTLADSLWETYYPRVFAYFYKRLNNREDVEDLTSLTMASFMAGMLDESNQINKPEAYLWRIAHNQLALFLRDKYKQQVVVTYDENWEFIDQSLESHRSESYRHRLEALHHCMEKHLKGDEFEIVQLSILEEKKSPEVAKHLDLTPVNVRQKLSRALKKLKEKCVSIWNNYKPQSYAQN